MAVETSLPPRDLSHQTNEKFAKALQFIQDMTKNCDEVQEKVLAEILAQNAETEYLRRFNLRGATDRNTFKSRVPVIKYEDLHPEILRIANGDRSPILSSRPISEFLTRYGLFEQRNITNLYDFMCLLVNLCWFLRMYIIHVVHITYHI